jgi:hypothetical protein
VDIAGLVKGAAEGEGLGNKFLANIRETSLICHVLRAFEDDDVVLTGQLDPYEDLQTVRMELILKDMETVQKSQETRTKDQKEKKLKEIALAKLIQVFDRGQMANTTEFSDDELEVVVKPLHLLTMKPEIFVINVSEEQLVDGLKSDFHEKIHVPSDNVVYISAKIESELASLTQEDQEMYLSDLGLTMSGIEQMANVAYQKLNLASYLTAGTIEVRAWTIKKGMTAQEAAGVIHTDFSKKFIKANVITFDNFVQFDGWKKAREVGKVRLEGKEYVVQDGDVIEFAIGS